MSRDALVAQTDAAGERFWSALNNRRLELPRCLECGRWHWPAYDRCPHCLADRLEWIAAAGTGSIYSFAVFHQLYHPAFESELPYNVAIIQLDEGPRLVSLVRGPREKIAIGKRVRVAYESISPKVTLHHFVPVEA